MDLLPDGYNQMKENNKSKHTLAYPTNKGRDDWDTVK